MPNSKTAEVRNLVEDVLATISEPYNEAIIEEVFLAIEKSSLWLKRYNEEHAKLGEPVVNQWIGRYTKKIAKMQVKEINTTKRSKLIKSYSKLLYK